MAVWWVTAKFMQSGKSAEMHKDFTPQLYNIWNFGLYTLPFYFSEDLSSDRKNSVCITKGRSSLKENKIYINNKERDIDF